MNKNECMAGPGRHREFESRNEIAQIIKNDTEDIRQVGLSLGILRRAAMDCDASERFAVLRMLELVLEAQIISINRVLSSLSGIIGDKDCKPVNPVVCSMIESKLQTGG